MTDEEFKKIVIRDGMNEAVKQMNEEKQDDIDRQLAWCFFGIAIVSVLFLIIKHIIL